MTSEILRDLARAKAAFQLRAIEAIIRSPASCDTHPKDGDSTKIEAPLVSGAVPEGQTPNA